MAPVLRLGAVQDVVGEAAEARWGADFAGELAGQIQILGDDVERAAGGEGELNAAAKAGTEFRGGIQSA